MTTRRLYLDVDPPVYTGSRERLDKDAFQKNVSILAARVRPERVGDFLKASPLKQRVHFCLPYISLLLTHVGPDRALLDLPKLRTVVPDGEGAGRLVLLRFSKESVQLPYSRKGYILTGSQAR